MNKPHMICTCADGDGCPAHGLFECHVPCTPPRTQAFFFAPGTVEDCSTTPTKTDTVARGLLFAAALAALAAAIGISDGWITLGGLF